MADFSEDIERCLEVLQQGGVILYPTDTIWGLGCDATNQEAVEKIYRIKNRPAEKSMIVLVAEKEDVIKYVADVPPVFDYLEKAQSPTTVIYDYAIGLAENVVNADGSIAIRIAREPFCRELIRHFGKPLVSTSANISGEKAPANFKDISIAVKEKVDYAVRYRQDDNTLAMPSSIIKWKEGKIVSIR